MGGGNNYGLNDSLQYFEFEFDSLDTNNSPSNESYSTDWPLFLLRRPMTQVAAVKILEVQIPFSYYVYNTGNNIFYLTESAGGGTVPIVITPGNYSTTTMITMLTALLNAASPNTYTYVVTFAGASASPATEKFTFTNNAGGVNTFTFTFGVRGDGQNLNPSLFLGFDSGDITSTTGQVLIAPNAALVTGPNYLYINSTTMGQQCQLYLPAGATNLGSGNQGPQMAKVPVGVQPGGIIQWQDPVPLMWFDLENLANLQSIDFYLTMGNVSEQTPLQLNGLSFSLKVGFLINREVHNDVLGGLAHDNRVTTLITPRKRRA